MGQSTHEKAEGSDDMAVDAVDQEARRMAQDAKHQADRALDRIDANQKVIDNALRDQKLFESEMRAAVKDLHDRQIMNYDKLHDEVHAVQTDLAEKITSGNAEIHTRVNSLIRALLGSSLVITVAMVGMAIKTALGW